MFVSDFRERSERVRCELAPTVRVAEASVGEVVTASDTSFLVLYPLEGRVTWYGADLAPRWSFVFTEAGPWGVVAPQSVALVGDSLLYVADRPRRVLRALDRSGRDRGTIPLGFPPQRVAATERGVVIAPGSRALRSEAQATGDAWSAASRRASSAPRWKTAVTLHPCGTIGFSGR